MSSAPKTFDQNDVNENKGLAIVMAIFPILFFLPLVMNEKKNSAFLMHQANQTLLILIANVVVGIVGKILAFIPIIGWLLSFAFWVFVLVLAIMNIVNAATGNGKSVPIIGEITIIK